MEVTKAANEIIPQFLLPIFLLRIEARRRIKPATIGRKSAKSMNGVEIW
ncbi:MAG: hypothetical protein QMD13_03110 [Candidatus Bathyarchaeia archaeon]|nr:hypothetical protein [Candidatus Bathyarchaeia archaeon]